MIRALLTAALLSVAALPAWAIDIQQTTSPGGIEAWLVEDHSIPFVALTLHFHGGATLDPEGKRGAVNLMAATLEEGSAGLDATEFAEAVEGLGASFGFDASDDAVTVTAQMLTENRDAAADLLAGALSDPAFAPADVDRVRLQVQAILRQEATDPQSLAGKELARQEWGSHPYGSSINGTSDSVAALTPEDLRDAKDRVLARDRVVVGASGDITPAELGGLLDRILGGLPADGTAPLPGDATLQLTGGVTVIDWDSPQTVVAFAGPGLPMSDPDYFAAFVADHILGGGGFSARLMDELREKRGLTYGIGTALNNALLGETWSGGMSSANAKVAEGLALIRQVWGDMRDGVSESELADAKTYLTGEYALRFDGNRKIASILAGMQLLDLPVDYINTRNTKIEAVTAADVERVAQRLLDPAMLRFVLVGRPEGVSDEQTAPAR